MLQTKDLMIGDLVQYKNYPVRVIAINPSNGYAIEKDQVSIRISDDTSMGIDADKVKPISLTEELLHKLGFVDEVYPEQKFLVLHEGDIHVYVRLGDFFIRAKNTLVGHVVFEKVGHLCLHELQHALKLCGIEKEIVC